MTLESKENYPRHTKIVQNSLGFMPEVKPLHKPRGDLVLCAQNIQRGPPSLSPYAPTLAETKWRKQKRALKLNEIGTLTILVQFP